MNDAPATEAPAVEVADSSTTGEQQETATKAEVSELYKDLGIDAPVPTGKAKGRPKSTNVRAKDAKSEGTDDTKSGREEKAQGEDKQKDAPDTNTDGDTGNTTDKKAPKDSQENREVSEEPEEASDRVRKGKPESEEDTERGSEENAPERDEPAGKRAKSNPEVEKRFQKLTSEVRERDNEIERLRQELQANTRQYQQQQVENDDPEYTMEDFRKVRDENGDVFDLDDDQAELAFRRWQDGYNQRAREREAEYQHQLQQQQEQERKEQMLMQSSVQAYDTLTEIMDDYPALDPNSDQFDQDFSNQVLPIIEDSVIYQPGTEPGNEDGYQPVIIGLRMNPTKILSAMDAIQASKRSLPLNGINDNIEIGSSVDAHHARSSDSMVNAANDLYKELGIKKRI